MNLTFFRMLLFSVSYKDILKYVFLSFLIVLTLPLLAVVVVTHTGIQSVSDTLATINIQDQRIEIHDPATGKVLKTIKTSVVWPVKGIVTLEFGESDLPYQVLHTGIDIANSRGKAGDPVTPFMKGKVSYVGDLSWGYGKHVIIDHGDNITSVYAHLDSVKVQKGQNVVPGDVIGTEGETGWATGPHLHFEVRIFNIPVNPRIFL